MTGAVSSIIFEPSPWTPGQCICNRNHGLTDFPTADAYQKSFRGGGGFINPFRRLRSGRPFRGEADAAGNVLVYSTYLGGTGMIMEKDCGGRGCTRTWLE